MESLTTLILAAGALGTAAFGIVEVLKWTPLGAAGFGRVKGVLGPLLQALRRAYGTGSEELLRAAYRDGRGQGELRRLLRQGIRVGLHPDEAPRYAEHLGLGGGEALAHAAALLSRGDDLPTELRNVLGRFELAVDARIDAGLALAESTYVGSVRIAASLLALGLALLAAAVLRGEGTAVSWGRALLIGIAAVPLAPIAKDLVSALQAAAGALRRR